MKSKLPKVSYLCFIMIVSCTLKTTTIVLGVNNQSPDQPVYYLGCYCLLPRLENSCICYIKNINSLDCLCNWALWFESQMLANPKDGFSRGMVSSIQASTEFWDNACMPALHQSAGSACFGTFFPSAAFLFKKILAMSFSFLHLIPLILAGVIPSSKMNRFFFSIKNDDIFLICLWKHLLWDSLEASHWDASDESHNKCFHTQIKKICCNIW